MVEITHAGAKKGANVARRKRINKFMLELAVIALVCIIAVVVVGLFHR